MTMEGENTDVSFISYENRNTDGSDDCAEVLSKDANLSLPDIATAHETGKDDYDIEGEGEPLLNEIDTLALNYQSTNNISCRQNFADCSNVFKAFIGSAMVGLPFATSQTGIGSTIIGVLIIAFLTDHCCALIVKCKQKIITNKIREKMEQGVPDTVLRVEERKLGRDLSFGRVGKICLGKSGIVLINTALMITQFGFTIGYFIFLGNTLRSILKYFVGHAVNSTLTDSRGNELVSGNNFVVHQPITNLTLLNTTSLVKSISHYFQENLDLKKITPDFMLNTLLGFALLLVGPLLLLTLISFIRNLRRLGPASVIANASLTAAFGATTIYIILTIQSVPAPLLWFKLSTFPILFGQVTGAFEGIGTVIPIESSMAENRKKYPTFLHISVAGLYVILTSFGAVGYLAYGEKTCQIITANLTGPIAVVLQFLLFVGVLFTYPLQIYPCIQITELLILKFKNRNVSKTNYTQVVNSESDEEDTISVPSEDVMNILKLKTWESNIVRMLLVLLTAAVALIFRHQFAYIAALTGSIGSSLLSFIVPALCHIQLTGYNKLTRFKDCFLIFFGIVGGISGVTMTIMRIIESFNTSHPAHC